MENLKISNVKIDLNILDLNKSNLKFSITNNGTNALPPYYFSFRILIDNEILNEESPKMSIINNTNMYYINEKLRYMNEVSISTLMKRL